MRILLSAATSVDIYLFLLSAGTKIRALAGISAQILSAFNQDDLYPRHFLLSSSSGGAVRRLGGVFSSRQVPHPAPFLSRYLVQREPQSAVRSEFEPLSGVGAGENQ